MGGIVQLVCRLYPVECPTLDALARELGIGPKSAWAWVRAAGCTKTKLAQQRAGG